MPAPPLTSLQVKALLAAAALSSAVGLVLELLLVTQASYLMGNATLATGVVVGTFLAAMGLGAWASQFIGAGNAADDHPPTLLRAFLLVELLLSPLCLLAPLGLFALFRADGPVWLALVLVTLLVGALGGMELPLLTRLLQCRQVLRTALARALALDYAGALVGSLLFPLVLLPWLGVLPTAALLALVPLLSTVALCWLFPSCAGPWRRRVSALLPLGGLAALASLPLGDRIEGGLYEDPVVERLQTRHQRIVLTRRGDDLRLFLDGQLQFSSLDEYRYHEALVHPAMALHPRPRRVLLLGAGDGLALRELLRWPELERVDLVELDPRMLQLARLYSLTFYGRLLQRLADDGVIVTQASTPFFTPKVLASIRATFAALDLETRAYSVDVPSFGPWGFVLAHRSGRTPRIRPLPFRGRWIDAAQLRGLFHLAADLRPGDGETVLPNRLLRPVLLEYQRQSRWNASP